MLPVGIEFLLDTVLLAIVVICMIIAIIVVVVRIVSVNTASNIDLLLAWAALVLASKPWLFRLGFSIFRLR